MLNSLNLTDLHESVDLLIDVDAEIGHIWKMPTPYDSVQFALTEVGEVVNARINLQQMGYARNNTQEKNNMAAELADVGMMILKYFIAQHNKDVETIKRQLTQNFDYYRKMLENTPTNTNPYNTRGSWYVPYQIVEIFRTQQYDTPVDDISKIAILVAYGMNLLETLDGPNPSANVVLATALFIIAGHEMFAEKPFLDYLKEKLTKTITKVRNREMCIQ